MSARREMIGDKRRKYQRIEGRVRIEGGWLFFDKPHRVEVEQVLNRFGDWEITSIIDYEKAEPIPTFWSRLKARVFFWRRAKLPEARLLK